MKAYLHADGGHFDFQWNIDCSVGKGGQNSLRPDVLYIQWYYQLALNQAATPPERKAIYRLVNLTGSCNGTGWRSAGAGDHGASALDHSSADRRARQRRDRQWQGWLIGVLRTADRRPHREHVSRSLATPREDPRVPGTSRRGLAPRHPPRLNLKRAEIDHGNLSFRTRLAGAHPLLGRGRAGRRARARRGEFTVLPGHAPFMTTLKPGVALVVESHGHAKRIVVRGGFADVNATGLTLLAEGADPIEEVTAETIEQEIIHADKLRVNAKTDEEKRLADEHISQLEELKGVLQKS